MDNDQLKQLDAKRLNRKEFEALENVLRGTGSSNDKVIVEAALDRERKHETQ